MIEILGYYFQAPGMGNAGAICFVKVKVAKGQDDVRCKYCEGGSIEENIADTASRGNSSPINIDDVMIEYNQNY